MTQTVTLTVNGVQQTHEVEPRLLLIHFLREVLGLTGPHVGCETSLCGACTVMLDGQAVKSCTVFAVQADGSAVTTIEHGIVRYRGHRQDGLATRHTFEEVAELL